MSKYIKAIDNFRTKKDGNIIIFFVSLQIIAIILGLIFPDKFNYISKANIQVLLKSIPQIGVIALGVNLLMISGEFDLSVGAIFTFAAFVMVKTYNFGVPLFLAVLAALVTGAFIGFLNGIVTTKTKIPSFIITLGFMYIWRGLILLISQSKYGYFKPPSYFTYIFTGNIWVIQMQFIWLTIIAIVCFYLLEKHRFGNQIFAVGGNLNAAKALGINTDRVKVMAFVITGILAGFSGVISTTRVGSVAPIGGEGLELQAIAACVIGGTLLSGGRGSIVGVFIGSAILYTMQDILLLLRAPGLYLQVFIGLTVIIAVVLNKAIKK